MNMEHIKSGNFMKDLRNANRYGEEVYRLVEEDLNFGLEKEQIDLYLKKNFKLAQMKVLSNCLRKGVDDKFVKLVASHPELTGYQVQVALDFFQKGVAIETIETSIHDNNTVHEMKTLYQAVLEKMKVAEDATEEAPAYVKEMIEQIAASVEKIQYQEKRYDELNKKLAFFEQTKQTEQERENMLQKYNDAEAIMDSQQSKLNQADSTITRLREQIADKEKEMKRMQARIDNLEDRLLGSTEKLEEKTTAVISEKVNVTKADIPVATQNVFANGTPVYYHIPVVDESGKMVQKVSVERNIRKTESGLGALFGKLGFKKKSRQDIVKLLASGNLVPAQLVQIKSGMVKGLTEGQLVELINNNVSAEKMKEIIEIAVLENSMDY